MALVQWRLLAPMWSVLSPRLALGAALGVATLYGSYTASQCGGGFLKFNLMWGFWPYYVFGYLARGHFSRELQALLDWRASHVVAGGTLLLSVGVELWAGMGLHGVTGLAARQTGTSGCGAGTGAW